MSAPIQLPALLPYALAYARRGHPVFPLHTPTKGGACSCGKTCGAPGKHPRTKRGLKDATTDENIIKSWWKTWSDANIGVCTGKQSGLLVIDVDPKNGGQETWDRVVRENEQPSITVAVNTGGGGFHLYFQYPKDRGALKSKGNAIKPGVDTRANGGYVVAPPSLHASGKRYEFRQYAGFDETEPTECPDWLLALLYPDTGARSPQHRPVATDDGWLLEAFKAAGLARRELGPDRWAVVCPWESEHSQPAGELDSSTVVFRPQEGKNLGHFHCSHAHCSDRSFESVRKKLPSEAIKKADEKYPPPAPQGIEKRIELWTTEDTGTDWQAELSRNKHGSILPTIGNVILILSNDPLWKDVLGFNLFSGQAVFKREPPWYELDAPSEAHEEVQDTDAYRLVAWLERRYSVVVSRTTADAALDTVSQHHGFHPVREYLNSLKWDGQPRLPTFAAIYLKATHNKHYVSAPRRWFIAAVKRVFRPGCQCDSMLVLEGGQNIGKSQSLRLLASSPWFADEIGDPGNKDAADALRGKWIVEIAELRWRRSDEETRKAFITRQIDHYRPSYGRRAIDVPRQCVLAASTNHHDWVSDPTGARRYWAVQCGERVDLDAIKRDRDQLWAEALVLYQNGEPSWLQDDEIPAQVRALRDRREIDPWENAVLDYCEGKESVNIPSILVSGLSLDIQKTSLAESRRITRILKANDFFVIGKLGPRGNRVVHWARKNIVSE